MQTKTNRMLEEARRKVANDPTHLGNLETLVRAQWASADYHGVLDSVRRLLALNPVEPGYHYLRGATLQCLGCFDEAKAAYRRCLRPADTPTALSAREAIRDIDRWPSEVAMRLAEVDPKFEALLRSNPAAANRALGFDVEARVREYALPAVSGPHSGAEIRRPS